MITPALFVTSFFLITSFVLYNLFAPVMRLRFNMNEKKGDWLARTALVTQVLWFSSALVSAGFVTSAQRPYVILILALIATPLDVFFLEPAAQRLCRDRLKSMATEANQ